MTLSTGSLLKNIFYGYEITDKFVAVDWIRNFFRDLDEQQIDRIYSSVYDYFSTNYEGVFGGQITAGDGLFISAMMERVRPDCMVEIGVASGYSSAFILHHARRMNLLDGNFRLHSYDLVSKTSSGLVTGSFLVRYFPEYQKWWQLTTEVSSVELMAGRTPSPNLFDREVLAFLDAGHNHPWPSADLCWLNSLCKPGTWVVLQDIQMMERWIADCILFSAECPRPVRGVNLALNLWPGKKIVGQELCYNCGAVELIGRGNLISHFIEETLSYKSKLNFWMQP